VRANALERVPVNRNQGWQGGQNRLPQPWNIQTSLIPLSTRRTRDVRGLRQRGRAIDARAFILRAVNQIETTYPAKLA